ncbi:MAG: AIPR family protein [Chloroflexota bacterium]|nr:AIPR family protein [Chloroflexota bacterium]
MTTAAQVTFEDFKQEWLSEVVAGNPSNVEMGHRFAHKLLTQWLDIDSASDDLVYCDGSGDGGIDIAYLDRGETGDAEGDGDASAAGDTWYIVQSKYGKALQGTTTLLEESQKVVDTLDGQRPRLSSLAEGLLERLTNFRRQASPERDRIVLVFATERPLTEAERRVLQDVRAMGRERLRLLFDVESVSIETVYRRAQEAAAEPDRIKVKLKASMVQSGLDLLLGSVPLLELYHFLKAYRDQTQDLDQLYEKNVRRFLGARGRINKGIQETLRSVPERFGLYNNGITIVVADFRPKDDGTIELVEPYVVNGCQTTRTIWDICHQQLEAGGTGVNQELQAWRARAEQGVVVTKIVKVGSNGEELIQAITQYTNSQNAVREKDFLALKSDFRTWAGQAAERYGIFLEIQRGAWDSQRALQKQRTDIKQFKEWANAFGLIKVYGSGWLGEAGLAFGKNAPFLPNGTVFKRIVDAADRSEEEPFGVDDLYATYLLQCAANGLGFGRGADKQSRRQTRFLFYMVALDLLRDVMTLSNLSTTDKACTQAIAKLFRPGNEAAVQAWLDCATEVVDNYLTNGTEYSVHDEPAFKNAFNNDLNGFLKWEKLGKSDQECPGFRKLLAVSSMVMSRKTGSQPSPREMIRTAIAQQAA